MTDLPELPFIDTMMTTMVFYGFDKKLHVKEAKLLIDNICNLLKETPSHAHVGMGEGKKSREPKFSTLDKLIAKGDFDNYSYFEAVNYFEKSNVRDTSLVVGVSKQSERQCFNIYFRSNINQQFAAILVLEEVLRYVFPQYGILYNLSVRQGPLWFIRGQWSSGMPDTLGRASSEFQQEYLFGKKFTEGFFRDVFKWNYLNKAHLDKTIEGVKFQDWIQQPMRKKSWLIKQKSRGKLCLLDNGCGTWELTDAEAMEVRPKMLAAGLLMVKS
jgi:hypothetical protein